MRAKKKRRIPAPQKLPHIFDDKFIQGLAQQAKLSWAANIPRFAAAIRDAAQRCVAAMATPTDVKMRVEIRGLYSAADRHRYKETATRIGKLSKQTRAFIKKRGDRPILSLAIPDPQAFNDPARRDDACETTVRLLRVGVERGKPLLYAPNPQPRPPRRQAERDFVMWLEVAYLEATGMPPPLTANPDRPGPFARMVQRCLNGIAPGANAVEMLNELHRRRKLKR
jgi:hypothetical protein